MATNKGIKAGKGRPTKYKPEMCQELIDFMAEGYSQEAAGAHLGIGHDTFNRWSKENQDFSEAVKEGRRLSLLWWEKIGRAGMVGKVPGFNATTWIFNMKNRHGWSDRRDITIAGDEDKPLITRVERVIKHIKD